MNYIKIICHPIHIKFLQNLKKNKIIKYQKEKNIYNIHFVIFILNKILFNYYFYIMNQDIIFNILIDLFVPNFNININTWFNFKFSNF